MAAPRLTPAQRVHLADLRRRSGPDRRWVQVEDGPLAGPARSGGLGSLQTTLRLVEKGYAEPYPTPLCGPAGGRRTLVRPYLEVYS